jgi:opacity protein-like surface antigen
MKISKRNFLILSFAALPTLSALAVVSVKNGVYVGAEAGYGFTKTVPFKAGTCSSGQACWNTQQPFAKNIGDSAVYGGVVGYHINPLWTTEVAYDNRNDFSWNKYFPGDPLVSPGARQRSINFIHDQTVMFNLYATPNLQWSTLDPYLFVGAGYAWNKTGILTNTNLLTGTTQLISGDTKNSFAWQFGLGADINLYQHVFFDVGYRFVNIGRLRTGTQITNFAPMTIPAVTANHAYVHEVYAGLNYRI